MSHEDVIDIKKVLKDELLKRTIAGIVSFLALGVIFYFTTTNTLRNHEEAITGQGADIQIIKGDLGVIKTDIASIKRDPELASAEMKELRSMLQMVLENQKVDANDIRDLRTRQDKFYDEIIDQLKRNKK